MKREKIFDAITEIREETLKRAEGYERPGTHKRHWWISAVAAVLVVAIGVGILLRPDGGLNSTAYALAVPEYPTMAEYPGGEAYGPQWESKYDAWREGLNTQRAPKGYDDGLEGYFAGIISVLLSGAQGENVVCSPLNVYMALAMLAETTAGESREEILTLLGHENIKSLRKQAGQLWNANYRDDGATTSLLASSLWLNEYLEYRASTVKTLAEDYYASVYQGEMGSEEYNQALRNWLNEQTGGLLREYADGAGMETQTVLALASAVYFKARWRTPFLEKFNREGVFHAADGDETCEFMYQEGVERYCWGDRFSAVAWQMENAGKMYFVLPDEGYTVEDLLTDGQVMDLITSPTDYENCSYPIVRLSLPKFDVSSSIDLQEGLKKLGVTQVFEKSQADFTPLTPLADEEDVWVSEANHAARVTVDEEGVEAAAYALFVTDGAVVPPDDEVEFVLDRPFLFMLTGVDGQQPLFVGVVNHVN